MDMVFGAPVVVKVFSALILVLILNAMGRHLAESIVAGTLLLALWCGHSAKTIVVVSFERVVSVDHLLLILVVMQVIWLSTQMAKTNVMADLVSALRQRLSTRVAIAALPAIIGLLPMPGGAIFSAPLVDDCDPEKRIDGLLKTHINYWFRHVWEYWWPLYPGVLMLQAATGLDAWQLLLFHLPLSLAAVTIGYWFLLRHVPRGESTTPSVEPDNPSTPPLDASVRRILGLLAPVFAVIGTYALIRLAVAPFLPLNRYVPMIMGLAVAVLIQQYKRPLSWKQWKEILLSNRTLVLALLVTVVRVYGAFIEHPLPDGVPLVEQMRNEFNAWGIPITAVIMAVPFVCGVATGLAVGFVGASFPIVMSLLGADPTFAQVMTTTALAFGFGYMGMILSPVHICLIVTNEHFGTRLLRSLKGLLAPALVMLLFTFLYSRLLALVL